ncbi:MAG: hypothetical protein JSR46_04560 [Verrucomicrobia bacterium]|nr:hypothetical protein [Verrucomicrobiota bacterium]
MNNNEFKTTIYSHFRKMTYPVTIRPTQDGWELQLHGETVKSQPNGLQLMQHLSSVEGLRVDQNIEEVFESIWGDIQKYGLQETTTIKQLSDVISHLNEVYYGQYTSA